MTLTLLAIVLATIPAAPGGASQPAPEAPTVQPAPAPPADEALLKELEEIDARGEKIQDLSADFTQEKFTALLKRPLVSEGRVRVRPPRTRWDTAKPHKSVLLLDDRELKLYDAEAGALEIYDVSGGLSRMTASPVPRLSAVKDEFAIERLDPVTMTEKATSDSFLAIRLTPTDEQMKEHVAEVRVLIDRTLACATQVEVTDSDGDRTVIRFKNLKTNTGLVDEDLDLQVPEGTTLSRPLEGLGGRAPGDGDGR